VSIISLIFTYLLTYLLIYLLTYYGYACTLYSRFAVGLITNTERILTVVFRSVVHLRLLAISPIGIDRVKRGLFHTL